MYPKSAYIFAICALLILIGGGVYYHTQEVTQKNSLQNELNAIIAPEETLSDDTSPQDTSPLIYETTSLNFPYFEGYDYILTSGIEDIGTLTYDGTAFSSTLTRFPHNIPVQLILKKDTSEIPFAQGIATDEELILRPLFDGSTAQGEVILGTPTDGIDTNERSGFWFVTPDGTSPTLTLQELPKGFVYESWLQYGDLILSGGTFKKADEADFFDGFSGEEPAPSFPGEDFLVSDSPTISLPLDIADGAQEALIFVTIEIQDAQRHITPSTLTILETSIPQDIADHELIPLENRARQPQLQISLPQ
jgi:hypothetical protein